MVLILDATLENEVHMWNKGFEKQYFNLDTVVELNLHYTDQIFYSISYVRIAFLHQYHELVSIISYTEHFAGFSIL